ncbi:hypothetical protein M4I32_11690 [Microbacterium sp. LRZ72]|uniref:hypothetical protein n=1 Tax=Microbacterium sp. LRZ72 TaxID=2942481 RepID=UPI0029B974CC|nr:hypothetical protein [Microbacterium sp. LRZ72]MDX2377462.1 hypothetical protein [Microbacterium sp. LRZ72]
MAASDVPTPTATASAEPDAPVEPAPLPTESAELEDPVAFDTGMQVSIEGVEVVTVEAETPGEVSGPAVVVSVAAVNDSDADVVLDSAVVTLVTDDGELGIPTIAGPDDPLTGSLRPGDRAEGSYVFMLDPAADRGVTVSVNYAAGQPVALFTGRTS